MRASFAWWRETEPDNARLLGEATLFYVEYHNARYARLLSTVDELVPATRPRDRLQLLDIGADVQTALLRAAHPSALVDTLGFLHPAQPPRDGEQHIEADLNDFVFPDRRPQLERGYDIVVIAEVVEHLYTPLSTILRTLGEWLRPPGFVVVQTPNGAALHKRLRLLMGRSPVEPPREERKDAGHLHEYTLSELREQVAAAGMSIERLRADNHFGSSLAARLYRTAGFVLPPTWRHGVTLVARAAP